MSEPDTQPDDLLLELKIQRLGENQSRLGVGFVAGFPLAIVLEESVRLLNGGPFVGIIVWFAAISIAGSLVFMRFARRWTDQSIRRQLRSSSKRTRKWLDKPNSAAVSHAAVMVGIIALSLTMAATLGTTATVNQWMSSAFAFSLVWGGLRFRLGDEIVCARCEYFKTPEAGDICPECGSAWIIADTLALGRAVVVPWMIVAGVIGIVVDLAMVAMSV